MSSIQKMSIHGIRSFGPDKEDKQIIDFFTPLTLILGPNGTGKTTIIECLKYITTGDVPPNSGRGGSSFVHDPKLAHENEVKGQVKLQFKDTLTKQVVITRSLLATQKQKKIEVKTLDGTITRKGIDGKNNCLTQRCADLNREMITCLGVSKAILNNVIFCHQEDSSWPLSEGKALKQKFDEIFAATRYIKALENIRKIRQELQTDLKVYTQEIKYLKQNKEQAAKIREDLQRNESRFAVSKDTVKKIKEDILPVTERLDEISLKENEISKLHTEIVKQEEKLKEVGKNIEQLREGISKEFDGSTEELKQSIRDFDRKVEQLKADLKQFESSVERKKQQCERLGKERSKLLVQIGKLKYEAEQHKEVIRKRDEKLKVYSDIYGFQGVIFKKDQEISNSQVNQILEMLNNKIESEKKRQSDLKEDYETREEAAQEKMNDFRDKKTKLEQAINSKVDQLAKNKLELTDTDRELSLLDASEAKLSQIDCELNRAEQEVTEAENSLNVQQMRNDLEKFKTERNSLEAEMRKIDSEMQRMHLQSSTQAELDLLRKDKINKNDSIRKLCNKNEEILNQILGHIPNDNIANEIKEFIRQIGNDCRNLSTELQKLKINLSSAENKRKIWMDQLKKKEEELKGFEEKVFQMCGSQDFDSSLNILQSSLKELQDEKGAIVGTQYIYKKYIEKLERSNPCCPLCRREFDDDQDVTELISDLNSKLKLIPNQLEMKQKSLFDQEKKFNSMLELKPLKSQILTITEKEIPELRQNIKNISDQINNYKKQIEEADEKFQSKQIEEDLSKSVLSDMILVDQNQNDLKLLDRKISSLAAKLVGGDSNRSMHQVNSEKEALQVKLEHVKQDFEYRQQKLSEHTELIQNLKSKVNDLKSEQLEMQKQLQHHQKLEEKRILLISENEECQRIISHSKEQISPLETKLRQIKEEKDAITLAKEKALETVREKMEEVNNQRKEIKKMNDEILLYIKDGKDLDLKNCEEKVSKITDSIEVEEIEMIEISNSIDNIRKNLSSQMIEQRELLVTLQIRQREQEIQTIETCIEKLRLKLGDFNINTITIEKRSLREKADKMIRERERAEGTLRELQSVINKTKEQLEIDMYKNVDQKHKNMIIKLKTTELTSDDLNKYYKALDRAIMKYHSMKMEEINKIIHELWRNTYRGNDIDYIEIRSEGEEDSAGLDKMKRVYNYKVVMVKGDAVLDMRGRCSAGQKVLASLIIRLALAETFCLNCGILALDEPTTNLDRDNIESLAHALADIVKSRQRQQNFQLVVITHDEDFVELLGRSEYVDHYFKVSKNERGLSRLQKMSIHSVT